MNRRTFLNTVIPAGLCVGFIKPGLSGIISVDQVLINSVIIKKGSPVNRYKKGIKEFGGIDQFVKKGQRVVIKPAMAYDQPPKTGINSDPNLVKEIIDQCYEAGAKAVSLFDHTVDEWTKCYKNSGIERIAKDSRARVLPANNEMFYSEKELNNAGTLKSVKIHNAIFEADVFINVAVARIVEGNIYSGALENLSGCFWERQPFLNSRGEIKRDELLNIVNPDLTVLDFRMGNSNNSIENFQVISENILDADLIAQHFINHNKNGIDISKVKVIKID